MERCLRSIRTETKTEWRFKHEITIGSKEKKHETNGST